MNDCVIENGACVFCGWKWAGDPGVHRNCPTHAKPREPRTESQQSDCLAVCATCEHWNLVRCMRCNCPKHDPAAWAKRLETGVCPLGKWPAPEGTAISASKPE